MSHRQWAGAIKYSAVSREIVMENLALWYRRFGEPESVLQPEAAPPGALAAGHLRVQMLYAPVNASDLIPITAPIATELRCPPSRGMKASALSFRRPRRLRICRVNAFCRCAGRAPGSAMRIARQSMRSPSRTMSIHAWPRGPISTRWRHR